MIPNTTATIPRSTIQPHILLIWLIISVAMAASFRLPHGVEFRMWGSGENIHPGVRPRARAERSATGHGATRRDSANLDCYWNPSRQVLVVNNLPIVSRFISAVAISLGPAWVGEVRVPWRARFRVLMLRRGSTGVRSNSEAEI